MSRIFIALSLISFALSGAPAFAQSENEGSEAEQLAAYEVGFQLGDLLPNKVSGVSEIMGLGQVNGGVRISPLVYIDMDAIFGNGSGVKWKNLAADIRMDIPVENLIGFAYVGPDIVYYKSDVNGSHLIFGGHVGGGLQFALTRVVWFRGDMKFNVSPGTSLYIGAGFEFRFGG